MSDRGEYTVGWICALGVEYVAAQEFLDEEHDRPTSLPENDTNDYTLGRISGHNVVIAVLPEGEYGTDSAASVATNMLSSFPNIKIGLLVGIGGGVPSQRHDIRLGDVVVSAPRDGYGGVFQYDFGKSIQGQVFQATRFLNQPPTILRTAMRGLVAQYERKGHQLDEKISGILSKNARLRIAYKRPQQESDMLFKAKVLHGSADCATTCASDPSRLIRRHERTRCEDNPVIHYGLIASANQLMKDALMRDLLAREKDVLCFEMEAAGLMNTFPCLAIRGICDYSDSHKTKEWQGYASMVAAAYAKDLLYRITPTDVKTVPKIDEFLSQECLRLFRLTSNTEDTTYDRYKDHVEARVHGTCEWFLTHETFQKWLERDSGLLLVSADPGCGKSVLAKYLIDEGLPRSFSVTICYFFFKSQDQNTTQKALCALLHQLFSQKPFLIEHAMEEFKNEGQGLINSTKSLWNIMRKTVQDPEAGSIIIVLDALDECTGSDFEDLVRNMEVPLHDNHSGRSKLKYLLTTRPYEQIVRKFTGLRKPYHHVRIPGEEESDSISREISLVIRYRVEQLAQETGLSDRVKSRLETRLLEIPHRTYLWIYLVFDFLTTEPFKKTPKGIDYAIDSLPKDVYKAYERILSKSKKDPLVRKALCVILAASRPLKVSEMNIALNVDTKFKSTHQLDLEDDEDFGLRLRSLCGLFVSVYHDKIYLFHETAREFLLASSSRTHTILPGPTWQHSITDKSAHAVLAEVCVAYLGFLNTEVVCREFQEERGQNFDEHQFLEYSAKNWGTHCLMARININDTMVPTILRICSPDSRSWRKWFTIYWDTKHHEPTACFTSLMISCYFGLEAIVKLLLKRGADIGFKDNKGRTSLSWAARNGHANIVKLLLDTNIPRAISIIPMISGWRASRMISFILGHSSTLSLPLYALHLTAKIGYEQTFQQLLRSSQKLEEKDIQGRSPLLCAVENSEIGVADILVRAGAQVNVVNNMQQNPIHVICQAPRQKDRLALLEYFISRGTSTGLCDVKNMTPLLYAVGNQSKDLILHLLDTGFDVNFRLHRQYWTAQVENRLVTYHINEKLRRPVERKFSTGLTALHFSALNGMAGTTALLLEHGANPNAVDEYGDTPLHLAIRCRVLGHEYNDPWMTGEYAVETWNDIITDYEEEAFEIWKAIDQARDSTVQQILNSQAVDVNIANNEGEYPLHVIPFSKGQRYLACAELSVLLDHGAKVSSLNSNRQTCLHLASKAGNLEAVRILIDQGCDISLLDGYGLSPVHYAVRHNRSDVIQLIFESRQEQLSQICLQCDNLGKSMLHHHTGSIACSTQVISILLKVGCDVDKLDANGNSALSQYLGSCHMFIQYDVFRLLFERSSMEGIRWTDREQKNLLHLLMRHWGDKNVRILEDLMYILDIKTKDAYGQGIEHHGAIHGAFNKPLTWFLKEKGHLELHTKDLSGKTPLEYAEEEVNRERHPHLFNGRRWEKSLQNLRETCNSDDYTEI